MTIDVLQAAKHLARDSGWQYTHLEMQKALYVCHMLFLGYKEQPLVEGTFEAWNYGPVHPYLYQCLKYWGRQPVPEIAFDGLNDLNPDTNREEISSLYYIATTFPHPCGPLLVGITHWEGGAWKKNYRPGVKGIPISNDDIREEFKRRYEVIEGKGAPV